MTYERTRVQVDGEEAVVETYPRQFDDVPFEYAFRRGGDAWVLKQPRRQYTDHAIDYARKELDERIVEICVPVEQTTLSKYVESACPSDGEAVGAASPRRQTDPTTSAVSHPLGQRVYPISSLESLLQCHRTRKRC